jgi:adenosylcobinamide kinase/adenosylcobinamide-phosphate guanylyltransferase
MSARAIVLVGGGARSGKSAFALALARRLGARRAFFATAQALDPEMERRIAAHRRERGEDFVTIEEPLDLPSAVRRLEDADVIVVDCLTLWISNMLLRGDSADCASAEVERLLGVLEAKAFHAVLVTNEVGMGVVPETALGRAFRDVAGHAHQQVARRAQRVFLAALGCVLRLKPNPPTLVSPDAEGEGEAP